MRAGYVRGQTPCAVVVDATGVGRPVVDTLKNSGLGCEVTAVTITGGDKQQYRRGESGAMNVPKVDLMAHLLMALEKGELKIAAKMRESGTLKRELLDVRMSQRGLAAMQFGADGAGRHDDLVVALALAVWKAKSW